MLAEAKISRILPPEQAFSVFIGTGDRAGS